MAVIHQATLSPSKLELLDPWLAKQPWGGGGGNLERVGSYRFDDPDGEVGVEGFLLKRGESVFHVVLTYRGTPLEGGADWLVGTMEHSVLGPRWVYDGVGDPVAVAALVRALNGEQEQATLVLHDGGTVVGNLEPDLRVRAVPAGEEYDAAAPLCGHVAEVSLGDARLQVARVLGAPVPGRTRLVASAPAGEAVIAALA